MFGESSVHWFNLPVSDKNVPRYNVAQLEQWARDQKIEDTGTKVIDTLLPIIQVSTYRVLYPSNVVHGVPF